MSAPLAGLRILDLTQYEAGTSATQMLAWLGADVVKVEPPGIGDPGRGRMAAPDAPDRWYFLNLNGNKRSLALNLKAPDGKKLFLRLLPRFDAVVENFGPGTFESFGLGYDVLKQHHPAVVFATLKGFGTFGPYADYKSFDMVAQATGGAMSLTGTKDTEPLRAGVTWGDTGTGMHLAIGILSGYVHRLKTGEGQHVEVSMMDAIANYARVGFLVRETVGDPVPRVGNDVRRLAPANVYACKPFGPNDYVYVAALGRGMIENLVCAIGHPELAEDPRTRTAQARFENADWFGDLIRDWTAQRTKHEAMAQLQAFGVPTGATFDSGDVFNDPHLKARGMVQIVNHPTRGDVEILGNPIIVDHEPTQLRAAPLLGEHTAEVLAEELGLSAGEIEALRAGGIVC